MRQLEHELRKAEAKQENDKDRILELLQQVEQLRAIESKHSTSKIERVRLRAQVDNGQQQKNDSSKSVMKRWSTDVKQTVDMAKNCSADDGTSIICGVGKEGVI